MEKLKDRLSHYFTENCILDVSKLEEPNMYAVKITPTDAKSISEFMQYQVQWDGEDYLEHESTTYYKKKFGFYKICKNLCIDLTLMLEKRYTEEFLNEANDKTRRTEELEKFLLERLLIDKNKVYGGKFFRTGKQIQDSGEPLGADFLIDNVEQSAYLNEVTEDGVFVELPFFDFSCDNPYRICYPEVHVGDRRLVGGIERVDAANKKVYTTCKMTGEVLTVSCDVKLILTNRHGRWIKKEQELEAVIGNAIDLPGILTKQAAFTLIKSIMSRQEASEVYIQSLEFSKRLEGSQLVEEALYKEKGLLKREDWVIEDPKYLDPYAGA